MGTFTVVLVASACGAFSAETAPPPPGADAAAPVGAEAGLPGSDAGKEASATDCRATLCEGFDTNSWTSIEQRAASNPAAGPDAMLTVDETDRVSPPRSLVGRLPPITGRGRYLVVPAGNAMRVVAKANMRVLARGGGEIDLFGVGNGKEAVAVVHAEGKNAFVVEHVSDGGSLGQDDVSIDFADWTPIVLTVDRAAKTYTARIGATAIAGKFTPPGPIAPVEVSLGFSWVTGTHAAEWVVRFDDLEVTLEP